MKKLIFEKPSLAPLPHRIGWGFFTAFFWMVWVYLWMPLVTLAFWATGLIAYGGYLDNNFYAELSELEHTAFYYSVVVCILGSSLLLWARIEFLRFHKVNRRSRPVAVVTAELAEYAKLPVHVMENLKHARRVTAHHDAHGHVTGGDVGYADDVSELQLA